jgi:hypothetical protein
MDPLGKLYCCENTWDLILEFKGGMEVLDLWERMMKATPDVGYLSNVYTYDQLRENFQHSHMILCQIMEVVTMCPHDYDNLLRRKMIKDWVRLQYISTLCGKTYLLTTKEPIRAKIIEAVYSFTLRELKIYVGEKWCYCVGAATLLRNPEAVFAEDLAETASNMIWDFQDMTPTSKAMETQLLSLQEDPIIPTMALTFVMGLVDHHTLADELFGFMNDYIMSGEYSMSHVTRLQIETMVLKVDGTRWVSLIAAGHQVMKFMNEFFSDDARWDKLYKWWSVSGLA